MNVITYTDLKRDMNVYVDKAIQNCDSLIITIKNNENVTAMENIEKVINVDADILGGTPVFYGTRVPLKNLFDYLETGETVNDFLQDFDSVKPYQAIRVLEISKKLIETSSSILV